MVAPFHNLLNTLKVVALERPVLGIDKIIRLFVNTLIADGKHYLLNRENLAQRIKINLSQKERTFS